jgi:hypothetical protein
MARKVNINVFTHPSLVKRFREVAKNYNNRVGTCLGAAMVLFLKADPETQGQAIDEVLQAEIRDEVEAMIETIKQEQFARVKSKEKGIKDKERRP